MGSVFIERLWRSLKYECVYRNAFDNGLQARREIERRTAHYDTERPHSTFDGLTPDDGYDERKFVPLVSGCDNRPEGKELHHFALTMPLKNLSEKYRVTAPN